ncbi:aspartate/glutamate racemase family protein [Methylobacterium gnaphalii]|uniref:Asp/Glu/hydantoin racemase n=1 Tax=Methylobacterium gnaphalii TaxID=1010610 RepID=A0A512JMH3_9HYPH|nr:aspartate/glutamate racemase family protein [Methylobacterium gnaphalii]GEP11167.1 Asp/Glu/hydantoin racemase [Methylobacterium gnaphalii]GJD70037.1 Hydantoin racemase [Methylobacterium gnaphalii]GLS49672.1 Asp/Glu/hydantoin racemase [Methylobacterium gnaphalii]
MRILLINPNTSHGVTDLLAGQVRRIAGSAVDIVPVTARFGARYIAGRAALAIAGHAALDALAEHVQGCDAVYLACFGDPGLAALQDVSPVPVVGMAEAACRSAADKGRFGIVTGGAVWEPILREFVTTLGLANSLGGIRTIDRTGGEIASDPQGSLDAIVSACCACAGDDGAGTVILGGAALAGISSRIQSRVPVPLLCSVEAGMQATLVAAVAGRLSSARAPMSETVGLSTALARLLAHE